MSKHMCPACGRFRLHRSLRRGFAERFVYPLLGKYPWSCKGCRKRVMLKDRDEDRVRRRSMREARAAESRPATPTT